jgi:glucokinase
MSATAHVIAGDIGGTKTDLAIFAIDAGGPQLVRERIYSSRDATGLEQLVVDFLGKGPERPRAGAFGIAGPVFEDVVVTTNLPWRVEAAQLSRVVGCSRIKLLNDLESTAYGALHLRPEQLHVLNPGVARAGHRAVIAAGTGLGQAFLFWDGGRYLPAATEGGHTDFGPRSEQEARLLAYLTAKFVRVSYERIVSGPGLLNIFEFLADVEKRPVEPGLRQRFASEDPGAVIGRSAVEKTSPICSEAIELFLSIYGAQAGNLALTVMAFGGVYVGGNIINKLLPLVGDNFVSAFAAKGRYQGYMREVPVKVMLEPRASLLGAAWAAAELAR